MEKSSPPYVDSPAKLAKLVDELRPCKQIGIDTEFISEGRYEPHLCLLQLAADSRVWIVDPLAVANLTELWTVLTEPDCELVAVAARQEIKFVEKGAGRPPAKILDLQIAAGLVGYGYPLSHTNLVLRILGEKIHGGESFTDWRKRPLTPVQLKYAADDVRYLLAMREKLLARADKMHRRSWVEAECERLVRDVLREEERWRVSGSARLSRRQLAVLRELWRWRDRSARNMNLPANRVLGDSMLVEVAKRSPKTSEDLFALRGLDRKVLREAENHILEAVNAALQLPDSQLPGHIRRDDPPQVSVLTKLLSVAANGLAAEHQVDTALLATTADLQDLVRWKLDADGAGDAALLEGWRGEILREPLLGILEGKRCVRVGDLAEDNPLSFEPCE
ncbi:MAG: HRDC domain-containing protein [Terriglobia bacterium]|nr:HRDC domain-containing protein [Terriglobia bacterium]